MAVVRLEALRFLQDRIVCAIPELAGRICLIQAPANESLKFPSLALIPVVWKYMPDQALDVYEPAPDRVVMNVGRHELTLQMRLGASSVFKRAELEQEILDLFLSTPMHPGVLLSQVTTCEELGDFTAAWELDEETWRNELAFDQELYSIMTVTGIIPALVTRMDSYTIQTLQVGLTTEFDGTSTIGDPGVEVVTVNADGTISPA